MDARELVEESDDVEDVGPQRSRFAAMLSAPSPKASESAASVNESCEQDEAVHVAGGAKRDLSAALAESDDAVKRGITGTPDKKKHKKSGKWQGHHKVL